MKYRKKPIVIEAHQLTKDSVMEICRWLNNNCEWSEDYENSCIQLSIPTLEGTMLAEEGDYIIKGIKGEFYPCKMDIFEATYEKEQDNVCEHSGIVFDSNGNVKGIS